MSRRARFWLAAVGACALILTGGLWLLLRDEPPPADQDLLSFRREVPDEANGFLLLQLGDEDVFWPDEEEAAELTGEKADDGEDWDEEIAEDYVEPSVDDRLAYSIDDFDAALAKQVVARNASVLRTLDEALARPDFQVPEETASRLRAMLGFWDSLRKLPILVCCRSRIHLEAGNDARALEDAVRLLEIGKRIQRSQGPLVIHALGIAFHAQGSHLLLYLAPRLHASPEALRAFIARSAALYPEPSALSDACRAEYRYLSSGDDGEGPGGNFWQRAWRRLAFKPNRARRLLAEEIRLLSAAASKPLPARDLSNAESERLFLYHKALNDHDRAGLRLSVARVMLALKCWHTVHERLPDTLDELVPECLERVPLDPFDGKPLRYSREKRLLHSVPEAGVEFPIELEP